MSKVQEKDNRTKIILIVLSYCVIFGLGIVAGDADETSTTSQPVSQPSTQENQPKSTPEPIKVDLNGSSNTATEKFKLRSGLATFKMHYGGDSNFIAHLIDANGNEVESLVNEIGIFDGSKAVKIENEGEYLINLENAMGEWSITVTQQ